MFLQNRALRNNAFFLSCQCYNVIRVNLTNNLNTDSFPPTEIRISYCVLWKINVNIYILYVHINLLCLFSYKCHSIEHINSSYLRFSYISIFLQIFYRLTRVRYMLLSSTNYFCLTSKLFFFNEYPIFGSTKNCFHLNE